MSEDRQAAPDGARARLPGRRGFLLGTGGLAAAALVGAGGGWLLNEQAPSGATSAGPTSTQPVGSGSALEVRRARALQLRITTARQQLADPFPQPRANGDEDRYDVVGLANFSKALPHNHLGEVDPGAYRALLRALRSGRPEDVRRIPLGGSAKLANPQGAFSFELQGPDPWGEPLTVGGGLNKLAFNMAFGRDTAGVHFRRDELRGITQ